MNDTPEWLDITEAIDKVRYQLAAARENAAVALVEGSDVFFKIDQVELELALEAKREVSGGFSFKVWVAGLDGKASLSSGATHRLKVALSPHDSLGGPIDVNSRASRLPDR